MTNRTYGAQPLEALDILLNNRGALYEGEIFSRLQHLFSVQKQTSFVIRSFEFALADGALDCKEERPTHMTYADRFWELDQMKPGTASLLLFDIKSKVSQEAGDQVYLTTMNQRQHIAFYIGICAADPHYVELIPNFRQEHPASTPHVDNREIAVNTSRVSRLTPEMYRLDPSNGPYRMPFTMLPEALQRVRLCALNKGSYVNPWTMVRFEKWRPYVTTSIEHLRPAVNTQHFTAYKAVREIICALKAAPPGAPMALDFVGIQPRLADFKLIPTKQTRKDGILFPDQVFIQHKIDGRDRACGEPLSKVAVARGESQKGSWYFESWDRFDFLFYQFDFKNRADKPYTKFFFLPERVLPDQFYTTLNKEESFDRPEFKKYYIRMDLEGNWVQCICDIIIANPSPRRKGPRPVRPAALSDPPSNTQAIQTSKAKLSKEQAHGRHDYAVVMRGAHRQFYKNIMIQCAHRHSGILVALATDHPMGDFGFSPYEWTVQEQQDFLDHGIAPKTINELPAHAPIVPIYYYTRHKEITSWGPSLTAPQFRRLNSCSVNRLIVWNLWGADETELLCPLVVIPSEDLRPTNAQRKVFADNRKVNKKKDQTSTEPLVSYLLKSGLLVADYVVGNRGPLVYDGHDWSEVWDFFCQFTLLTTIQYPEGWDRDPASYRHPLRDVHERLVEEDMRPIPDTINASSVH